MRYMGFTDIAATISEEIGGGNGIQPMLVASEMGKPVADADLMGRAYPNVCDLVLVPHGLADVLSIRRCTSRKYMVLIPL